MKKFIMVLTMIVVMSTLVGCGESKNEGNAQFTLDNEAGTTECNDDRFVQVETIEEETIIGETIGNETVENETYVSSEYLAEMEANSRTNEW